MKKTKKAVRRVVKVKAYCITRLDKEPLLIYEGGIRLDNPIHRKDFVPCTISYPLPRLTKKR